MMDTNNPTARRPGPGAEWQTLHKLLDGYRSTALLYVAAKLGLADLLADGPLSSAELAQMLDAHAPSLHRLLRGMIALGICAEEQDGRFGLTAIGEQLRSGGRGSLRGFAILCGEEYALGWGGLLHSAMTGESGFNHARGMSQWEHRQQHPELDRLFNKWMAGATAGTTRAIAAAYDFSPFHVIADIGGGHGALLAAILQGSPAVSGILFDQPSIVAAAGPRLKAAGLRARCQLVAGDFFTAVPEGADAYVLKSVIHDWDDEKSALLLGRCRDVMSEQSRLLLIERLMPERVQEDPVTVWIDLHMLAMTGGQERTEAEYRALLASAGFTLNRIIPTRSPFSIIEAAVAPKSACG